MTTYNYSGQVVHKGTRQGIAGLRVEAWDASHVCTELVSAALTDASGAFVISVDNGVVQDLFLGRVATIYFKVFHERRAIAETSDGLFWRIPTGDAGGRIEVKHLDQPIGRDEPAPCTVRGRVLNSATGPMPGVTVNAAHKTLRSEVALGTAVTDAAGRYQIRYAPAVLEALGKSRADLVLHVLDANGAALADSPVAFQAPVTATIDVTVGAAPYTGPAESDAILAALERTASGLGVADLSASDQAFLVSAEGLDPSALTTLVAAAQLGQAAGRTSSNAGLSPSVVALYAAGREGIPLTAAGNLPGATGSSRGRGRGRAHLKRHPRVSRHHRGERRRARASSGRRRGARAERRRAGGNDRRRPRHGRVRRADAAALPRSVLAAHVDEPVLGRPREQRLVLAAGPDRSLAARLRSLRRERAAPPTHQGHRRRARGGHGDHAARPCAPRHVGLDRAPEPVVRRSRDRGACEHSRGDARRPDHHLRGHAHHDAGGAVSHPRHRRALGQVEPPRGRGRDHVLHAEPGFRVRVEPRGGVPRGEPAGDRGPEPTRRRRAGAQGAGARLQAHAHVRAERPADPGRHHLGEGGRDARRDGLPRAV